MKFLLLLSALFVSGFAVADEAATTAETTEETTTEAAAEAPAEDTEAADAVVEEVVEAATHNCEDTEALAAAEAMLAMPVTEYTDMTARDAAQLYVTACAPAEETAEEAVEEVVAETEEETTE